jgi:MFS family permease
MADGATQYAYYAGNPWTGIEFFVAARSLAGVFSTHRWCGNRPGAGRGGAGVQRADRGPAVAAVAHLPRHYDAAADRAVALLGSAGRRMHRPRSHHRRAPFTIFGPVVGPGVAAFVAAAGGRTASGLAGFDRAWILVVITAAITAAAGLAAGRRIGAREVAAEAETSSDAAAVARGASAGGGRVDC